MQFPGFLELEPIYPSPYLIRSLFSNISSTLTVTLFFDSTPGEAASGLRQLAADWYAGGDPTELAEQRAKTDLSFGRSCLHHSCAEGEQLHWLPIRQRIIHKLWTLTYKSPGYS